jgi:hypothetical protein
VAQESQAGRICYSYQNGVEDKEYRDERENNYSDRHRIGKIESLLQESFVPVTISVHSEGENAHDRESPKFLHLALRMRSSRIYAHTQR